MNFEQKLKKYAEIIVELGLNIQPGQRLIINAPLEAAPLTRLIAEAAYKKKCKLVDVLWRDEQLTLTRLENAPRDSFGEYPTWKGDGLEQVLKKGGAVLVIDGGDPDLLAKQDPKLIALMQQAARQNEAKRYKYTAKNKVNWCRIASATFAWAAKVFPNLPAAKQLPALWQTIFTVCRVNNNAVADWKKHIQKLSEISGYLNKKQYTALHFSALGTDLTAGLPEKHIWSAAFHHRVGKDPITFIPNIPTEEIFTSPHRNKINGSVASSKPLHYGGICLKNFTLTFKNGRVIDIKANKKDKEVLKKLIGVDKGAARLGEVALVPHSSPISRSKLLFYETLYDENAACHLALGKSFTSCIANGSKMSDKAFAQAGGNQSLIHVDFMIGSGKMNVVGIKKDGTRELIMRSGEWAFNKNA